MSTARDRELRKQNRLLVRQERLAERDVAGVMGDIADELANRWTPGAVDTLVAVVTDREAEMAAVMERRIRQTALIFGERTLNRITASMQKSYYPNLPIGSGPVRGRDQRPPEAKNFLEVFQQTILQWAQLRALDMAALVIGTARDAVRAALLEAVEEGLGEADIVRLIRGPLRSRLTGWQAARIARTEMHTAANVGSDEAARSTGLKMVKEWASAEDGRTRFSHMLADGQEVAGDDAFTVGGAKLMFPGDPAAPAREIVNCRCAVLHWPVIGGQVIR